MEVGGIYISNCTQQRRQCTVLKNDFECHCPLKWTLFYFSTWSGQWGPRTGTIGTSTSRSPARPPETFPSFESNICRIFQGKFTDFPGQIHGFSDPARRILAQFIAKQSKYSQEITTFFYAFIYALYCQSKKYFLWNELLWKYRRDFWDTEYDSYITCISIL